MELRQKEILQRYNVEEVTAEAGGIFASGIHHHFHKEILLEHLEEAERDAKPRGRGQEDGALLCSERATTKAKKVLDRHHAIHVNISETLFRVEGSRVVTRDPKADFDAADVGVWQRGPAVGVSIRDCDFINGLVPFSKDPLTSQGLLVNSEGE
uniref:Uncharacterized protein n=1 Tax=Chromera velia CCMP2878 TaxID=1169474 RepID=A0A0G4GDY8_9ALVE|eukprot:Cvel_21376.t1-p1 / transcript=Cvel_21376.t1 / gene=Cvel_21376 / organism=Chromera_velia_CCMP2878 / gene_product=hypothetical protein / transcript_product=hypothetical protein / location=Cvel_scaffold1999:34017-35464(+) / protein_length=153 / sequence_SO=supercontig / SO=protein_coding / is_pseudo=false